jgi:hypothetical protein
MNEQDYIKNRLDQQIEWYSDKANSSKKLHLISKGIIIILSSLIPLIAGFDFSQSSKNITLSILGFLISIIVGLSSLLKFQENWTEYRTTSETLKHEKMLFQTKTGPYDNTSNSFNALVTRIENLISKEHSAWSQYVNK